MTAYAIAQALAPALFASLADHLGRRPVLLVLVALLLVGFTLPETTRAVVGNGERSVGEEWKTWWCWLSMPWQKQPINDGSSTSRLEGGNSERRREWSMSDAVGSFIIMNFTRMRLVSQTGDPFCRVGGRKARYAQDTAASP